MVDREVEVIPPKGSGRPRSRVSREIEGLPVNGRAAFRGTPRGTLAGLANYWGKKLGRKYATRQEPGGIIAVWRVA